MGFFDRIADAIKEAFDDFDREVSRITSRGTFERVCQAAFLIARADGSFDPSEKAMLQRVLASKLPQFKAADILAAIGKAEGELEFTVEGGIGSLLANISRAKGSEDAALIMLVCCAIGAADGDFDENEKAMARRIAVVLGVEPGAYGL